MIRITLNSTEIMKDTAEESREVERQALFSLLTTKSTDSKSAQSAAEDLGGLAYAELLASIPADGTVEVFETPKVKNATESLKARYTVGAISKRVIAAATQAERQGEIFTDKPEDNKPATTAPKAIKGLV